MSAPAHAVPHHTEAPRSFIRRWVFATDHKVIGLQYWFLSLAAVSVGMVLSWLFRTHLAWPNAAIPGFGGVMKPEQYLALVTMHGTLMIFFVLTVAPQSGFGNYFLPIQIGADDMAFPRINMLSFWTTFVGFLVMMAAFVVSGGAPINGWTSYPPLSAVGQVSGPGQGMGETLWVVSIALFCGASLMTALNFIATTIELRARGMSLMRMPLTVWGWFVTAVLGLLAFGVLLAACILLLLDRLAYTSFFIPSALVFSDTQPALGHAGGSPLLWQHLFWFFGHPEVYIAILPGMGITSHVLSTFSRKPIFGYKAMAYSLCAIAFLSFTVWGHHMFISGMSPYSALAFSFLTLIIGVPSAIKTFNWLGTLWGAKIQFTTAMLFAIGFVSMFVTGGVTGLFLAQPAVDLPLHDTLFVVAHFHLVMGVAAIFGIFAGTYYWFPKMFGRKMNETLGKAHFWFTFVGAYLIFMPMHWLGIVGSLRRYADASAAPFLQPLEPVQHFITIAAFITGAGQLLFYWNFFWSIGHGEKVDRNPWHATTLEWTVPSPPPHGNFAEYPQIYRGPYEYAVPGYRDDYIPQDLAPDQVAKA
ncbi:MAG TPA: cbb3-type cytochrome c oxidase subunit I [Candidatus Acidoferrales bacterium]|nr:cbb3-type cytochrome c oxidase subunit I [Candidatus Acidoferrales bacterium]